VLQLISSAGYYGAENMLVNLAAALAELHCEPVVGAFRDPAGSEPDILRFARERGLKTWEFPCGGRIDRASIAVLRKHLADGRFDVLHTHGYKANLYGWLAGRRSGVSQIATCHNWPNRKGALAVYAALDRLILRQFPRVVAVSEGVQELLANFGIRPPQSDVINNGIDTGRFSGEVGGVREELGLAGKTVVGTITRLVPGKGVEVLLDCFPALAREYPEAVLLIVGAGPLEAEFKAQAQRLGLGEQVIFTGARSDMPAVYSALDVFVLASFDEGMPMTVLEAMSSARSVVATRVGGIPLLIRDGENGRLIEARDAAALTAALRENLADAALRQARGAAARETILRDFSALAMARQYVRHYSQITQRKREAA
jgi:glycosyltransferase involved in cell wall biosynthesis